MNKFIYFTKNIRNININDIFRVHSAIISEFEMIIFDRWGNRMYQTKNIDQGWDGKQRNQMAQEDVYVCVVNTTDFAGTKRQYKTHFSLLR